MGSASKYILFSMGALAFLASVATQDYSNHDVVIRMEQLDDLLRNNDPDSKKFAALSVRDEIKRNSPSQTSDVNTGESMIAMLKLLALLEGRYPGDFWYGSYPFFGYDNFWKMYTTTIKELAQPTGRPGDEIQKNQGLAEYILDWYSWNQLLKAIGNYEEKEQSELELISYVCLLTIKNTNHLKNSFTKGMMLKLNNIRNKANAINAIYSLKELGITGDIPAIFTFDDIIINRGLSSRDEPITQTLVPQMKKILIEETIEYSLFICLRCIMVNMQERATAIAYYTLLELTDEEFINNADAVGYALELYHLSLQSEVIENLKAMLTRRVAALPSSNNAVADRLKDFEYARNNIRNNKNAFNQEVALTPKRLDYLTIVFRTINKGTSKSVADHIKLAFYKAENVMLEPNVFNNPETLDRFDKNHIALYMADEFEFHWRFDWLNHIYMQDTLERYTFKADELLKSIANETPENTINARNQVRIVLRFAIQMSNIRKKAWRDVESIIPVLEVNAVTYIKLMKLGADIFINDPQLMKEWYQFTLNFPEQVSKALDENTIAEITRYRLTLNSNEYAINYVFLARILNFLAFHKSTLDTNQLAKIVFELEKRVGNTDTVALPIWRLVSRERQIFYIFFAKQAIDYEPYLSRLVEHHIELFTALNSWHEEEQMIDRENGVRLRARLELLDAIYTATVNDPDAKTHLNDPTGRLRSAVNQITSGLTRKLKLNDDLLEKIYQCEPIFGKLI